MNKDELIEVITAAFDGVPQPQDITLLVAQAHDDYDYGRDHEYRQKDYFGPWQNIPDEHIASCQEAICYLDKDGMRFYLPAYMVWYLNNFDGDVVLSNYVLYAFDYDAQPNVISDDKKERFSLFDAQQKNACACFLKYFIAHENFFSDQAFAKEVYQQYWYQHDFAFAIDSLFR